MKNIKTFILFFSLIAMLGCEENTYKDYSAPDELSDLSWLLGLEPNRPSRDAQFKINADTYISFLDLSQGTLSHEWIVEEGNSFLKEGFSVNDTLTNFIDESKGTTTSEGKAHILFRNSGINKVRLLNKFSKDVSPNISGNDVNNIIVNSSTEGDVFVKDVEFIFDIYATIQPAFKVYKDGNEVLSISESDMPDINDERTWPVIEIEAATGLTFEDLSTVGRPNRVTWDIPDGVPSLSGTPALASREIKFYKLGTFNAGVMRSLRQPQIVNGVADDSPNASVEKIIPLKVKVIQSSQPFVFDGALNEDENEVIRFRVNGEISSFSGQESAFTVNVKNSAASFDQDIAVQTARVKSDDATFIELVLSAPIYNSDVVTVAYNGNGILSADDRVLQPFTAQNVQMNFGNNILPSNAWGSFEPEGGNHTNAYATGKYWIPGGGGANGNLKFGAGNEVWIRDTNKSYTGGASMKYQLPDVATIPTMNLFGFGIADPAGIPQGLYRVSYWVFIDPSTTLTQFRMEFQNPVSNTLYFDISSVAKGQWVRVTASAPLVYSADVASTDARGRRTTLRILQNDNPGVSGAQLMYFDELTLIKLEERP